MPDQFFGVYLLYSLNEKFLGRIYIGFTVDPSRRIVQHNRGTKFGGAKRTNNKGPWEMLFIVCGFPNEISALRFEWAWQHPIMSRRLNQLPKRKTRESLLNYHLRLLDAMISSPPWTHLPLNIQLLNLELTSDIEAHLPNKPTHMDISRGPINGEPQESESPYEVSKCEICESELQNVELTSCYCPHCTFSAHLTCLASRFLEGTNQLLPITGQCPSCRRTLIWGKLVEYRIPL